MESALKALGVVFFFIVWLLAMFWPEVFSALLMALGNVIGKVYLWVLEQAGIWPLGS